MAVKLAPYRPSYGPATQPAQPTMHVAHANSCRLTARRGTARARLSRPGAVGAVPDHTARIHSRFASASRRCVGGS